MMTDRTAQRQHLDDQIARAKQAAATLAGLQAETDRLPELQREKKRRDLEQASAGEMERATASGRTALAEAGATLTECRALFTRLCADARVLAEKMTGPQRQIYATRDLVEHAVRGRAYAELHGDPRLASHEGDRLVFMALSGGYGETWPGIGGAQSALLAFPSTSTALEYKLLVAVAAEVRDATGQAIFHPGSWADFSPFQLGS